MRKAGYFVFDTIKPNRKTVCSMLLLLINAILYRLFGNQSEHNVDKQDKKQKHNARGNERTLLHLACISHLHDDVGGKHTEGREDAVGIGRRITCHHHHRHGFAERTSDTQDQRGGNARFCGRRHNAKDGFTMCCAEGNRAFVVGSRHGFEARF